MKSHRQKQDYETMEPSKKKLFLARIKLRPGKPSSPEIQNPQFPAITLAWACTVHKVQGLTVNEIVVCFDMH